MNRFQQSGKALGSDILLTLVVDSESLAQKFFQELWYEIVSFENRFSRFKEDSELSHFNQHAGEITLVSDDFQSLLKTCSEFMTGTSGLFNPFILPALQRAGYKGSWPTPAVHDKALSYESRTSKLPSEIKIVDNKASIPKGTALDFGGIGKGYLLDMLADNMSSQNLDGFWLSIGGDIICQGNDLEGKSWKIGVAESDGTDSIATIQNIDGARLAVATSGITKRKGPNWHHIIDPRTGKSAETDILMATVAAHSGTEADIYAKCLVVLSSEHSKKFIEKHGIHQSVLQIWDNGNVVVNKGGDLS